MDEIKNVSINFERESLEKFDKIAGGRKRSLLLNQVLKNYIIKKNVQQELPLSVKKSFFTSSVKLPESLINKIDDIVGRSNRSAFIRLSIEKYLKDN